MYGPSERENVEAITRYRRRYKGFFVRIVREQKHEIRKYNSNQWDTRG